jgi:hypothetical protein
MNKEQILEALKSIKERCEVWNYGSHKYIDAKGIEQEEYIDDYVITEIDKIIQSM